MRVIYCMLIMCISINCISQYNVIQEDTANKVYQLNKGNEYFKKGDFEKAEGYYKKSLEFDKLYYKAYLNTGHSLFRQAVSFKQKEMLDSSRIKCSEAESFYRNSIELTENKDEKAESLYNLGNSQLLSQKLEASIKSYKESLRLFPENMDTKHNLALAQYLLNKQQENQEQKEQQENQEQKESQALNEDQINQILNALEKKDQKVQKKLQKKKGNKLLKDW